MTEAYLLPQPLTTPISQDRPNGPFRALGLGLRFAADTMPLVIHTYTFPATSETADFLAHLIESGDYTVVSRKGESTIEMVGTDGICEVSLILESYLADAMQTLIDTGYTVESADAVSDMAYLNGCFTDRWGGYLA